MTDWQSFVWTVCALAILAACIIGIVFLVFFSKHDKPDAYTFDRERMDYWQGLPWVEPRDVKLMVQDANGKWTPKGWKE